VASWRRGWFLVIGGVAVSVLLGLAVVRSLVSESSPGPGWVRVGSIQDVRSQGVVPLPQVPAYVVVVPREVDTLSSRPSLIEKYGFLKSSS
jgi:hypothetical protein